MQEDFVVTNMRYDSEPTISSEDFDTYGHNECCRVSRRIVQGFVDRELMSQDEIYHRYTETLSERLISARRSDQPRVVKDIRSSFQYLRDPEPGCLSLDLFRDQSTQHLLSLSIPLSQETSNALLSILTFHAYYPFPSPNHWSRPASDASLINEDAFVRAVCLLTLSPFPFQGPDAPSTHHCYSGTWGPHRGQYIARRGKDAGDFRRRVFRSIAIPGGTSTQRATMVNVPRFVYYVPFPEEESERDEVGIEMIVVEKEREVDIDVVDVLSECPPEEDSLTADPFRESYRVVLPNLPHYNEDLSRLFVPKERLKGLMEVLYQTQAGATTELATTIERLGNNGNVGWREFDSAMVTHAEFLANSLSKIFWAFTASKA